MRKHPCVICGKDDLGRRFGGNNLCKEHWQELLDAAPSSPFEWIEEHE